MPLWAILLGVGTLWLVFTAMIWAACKVGGDAEAADKLRQQRADRSKATPRPGEAMRVGAPGADGAIPHDAKRIS